MLSYFSDNISSKNSCMAQSEPVINALPLTKIPCESQHWVFVAEWIGGEVNAAGLALVKCF